MVKRLLFLASLVFGVLFSKAQTADSVLLNKLGDFDMASLSGDANSAVSIGERILPDTGKMEPGIRVNFFAKLAKAYGDVEEDGKALTYFEKVAAAEPNYYVAQRGLGYLYNDKAEAVQLKLYATDKNSPDYHVLFESYREAVLKTLPHLEKAQACDPDDDTLDLIRTLYTNIHDEEGLNSLTSRLPDLAKNCVDLLSDK
jgi:tetratricopeptide (TPR) repeat protein